MNKKKGLSLFLAVLLIVCCFVGCGNQSAGQKTQSKPTQIADLADRKIGLITGSLFSIIVPKMLPDATIMEFNSYSDLISALEHGKVDVFPTDESIYKSMLWEGRNVTRIDESIAVSDYGMIFRKGDKLELQNQINTYLAKTIADGTHKTLEEKWLGDTEPTEFVDYEGLPAVNGTLKIGICSSIKPFVYLKNDRLAGFDIEFIVAFAKEYGYAVEFEDTAFSAIIAGVTAGKYDIGMSGITVSDERKEESDCRASAESVQPGIRFG